MEEVKQCEYCSGLDALLDEGCGVFKCKCGNEFMVFCENENDSCGFCSSQERKDWDEQWEMKILGYK